MVDEQTSEEKMVEEIWRSFVTIGEHTKLHKNRNLFKLLPGNPRCKFCNVPFQGFGAPVGRILYGKRPSNLNPRFCNVCEDFADKHPGGVEAEISMLFADIRGSTTIAENISTTEFRKLINRFYKVTTDVLIQSDALIDKLIGDEVAAFFVPGFAGEDFARHAIDSAVELLHRTGHTNPGGPWVPVGVGVHTGVAFIGSVGTAHGMNDITALGDAVNVAARLASHAATGEVLVSEDICKAANFDSANLEIRELELKGKSNRVTVRVIKVGPK